MPISIDD